MNNHYIKCSNNSNSRNKTNIFDQDKINPSNNKKIKDQKFDLSYLDFGNEHNLINKSLLATSSTEKIKQK